MEIQLLLKHVKIVIIYSCIYKIEIHLPRFNSNFSIYFLFVMYEGCHFFGFHVANRIC